MSRLPKGIRHGAARRIEKLQQRGPVSDLMFTPERLKAFLPVPTRFVLDYFHVSMKLRHIDQCIGAIPPIVLSPGGSVFELYDRFNYLRGYLWSGRRAKFDPSIGCSTCLIEQRKSCRTWIDASTWPLVIYVVLPRTFARMNPA